MATNLFNTTTLTNALDNRARTFVVGSTANLPVGARFVIDREMFQVQEIPASGTITVQRALEGTQAVAHAAGATLFIETASAGAMFGPLDSNDGVTIADSVVASGLPMALPLGTRRRDAQGNEFVLCEATAACFGRQAVAITETYTCAPVGTTGRGRIGVATEPCVSDQYIWVQIYGRCMMQIGMSGVSPSDAANGPTTLSTSVATMFALQTSATSPAALGWVSDRPGTSDATHGNFHVVENMWVASDAAPGEVSAVTSAASHTGSQIAVFLAYPVIRYVPQYVS